MPRKKQILSRSSTMVERLHRLHKVFHGDDRVLIVINADPDAISSAMALKRLLWRRVGAVTIARTNTIKRPDNLALLHFLKLHLFHVHEVHFEDYTRLAMVDSQPYHMEDLQKYQFDVVIDHHPLCENQALFLDIRPGYGANATIMTEYLRAARIKPSRNLATALFYGIKTDTSNFVRQGQVEDMRAFQFLFPYINQNMVSKIENSELTRASLKHFQKALEKLKIYRDRAFVYMGRVDNPDTLVIIAEFFMKIHDINRSIAAGIFKDQLVVIFRMAGQRTNAGRLAAKALGGFGSAGGHKAMARAEVPLTRLDPKLLDNDAAIERFIRKRISQMGAEVKNKTNHS